MQRLEVSGAVRLIYKSLCVKELITDTNLRQRKELRIPSICICPANKQQTIRIKREADRREVTTSLSGSQKI